MNTGQRLYETAKQLIPGGTQLLSKRPELFLPNQWPSYYSKAKGCTVWHLDGNAYDDFTHMGVGTCILGMAHPHITHAAKRAITQGSMSTLNAPEEVALAQKLLALHPWADQARFGRTGGEMCAVAIRLARAATHKDIILFCGYHGWHDWYLSANLKDENSLDEQLLPGLSTAGVPHALKGTAIPFHYQDKTAFDALLKTHHGNIAAVIMEPTRSTIDIPFLKHIRKQTQTHHIPLIFDEVTSGFRRNAGGIHLTLGVTPDMTILGKALGNGIAIAAVLGKKHLMSAAQDTFISSTYWTERTGFAAALAFLEYTETHPVFDTLTQIGTAFQSLWKTLAKKHSLTLHLSGIPPLTHVQIDCKNPAAAQTFITQELLKKGILGGNAFYASLAHTPAKLKKYQKTLDPILKKLAQHLKNNTLETHLEGPIKHSGFSRLN